MKLWTPSSLAAFAASLGITAPDQVVIDPDRRLAGGEGVTLMVSELLSSFLVSGTLEAPPVFSYARPLGVVELVRSGKILMARGPQTT